MAVTLQVVEDENHNKSLAPYSDGVTASLLERVQNLEQAIEESVIYGPRFALSQKVVRGDVFFSAYAYSSAGAIAKLVLNIPELGINDQEYEVARTGFYGNSALMSFNVPDDMAIDTELNVSVYAVDSVGTQSETITKTVTVSDGIIAPPNIISPADGATVIGGNNRITLKCSQFSSSGIDPVEDVYADWKVTRDEDGNDVISLLNHSNTAAENYAIQALGVNDFNPVDMYVRARHGCASGSSEWGVPTLIKVSVGKRLPSGRILSRHSSGEGSVLEWDDFGVRRRTLISDSTLHLTGKYNGSQVNYGDSGMPITNNINTVGTSRLYGEVIDRSEYKYLTDDDLNKIWEGALDSWTSTQNTDLAIGVTTSGLNYTPLIKTITTMTLAGARPSIPNINTLIRIYCDSEAIQAIDPTNKNLFQMYDLNPNGIWIFGSNLGNGCWSSSFLGSVNGVYSMIGLGRNGGLNASHMGNSGNGAMTGSALCLVPILEL